jgi:predicted glycogen debranching enzyme
MDARVGDWVVTPRRGKPVEVSALWFNAVSVVHQLARDLGDDAVARESAELARRCGQGFESFWIPEQGYLYDVLASAGPDASLRPNQVLAASLAFPVFGGERARSMLAVVERELLTPVGLRSLAPSDPAYRGRYGGGPSERDGVYHQGTVWPWLLGPFVSALVATAKSKPAARKRAAEILSPLLAHTRDAGLGSASEIFDGDAPHAANGCPWQAWSVAEVLRAWVEEVGAKP